MRTNWAGRTSFMVAILFASVSAYSQGVGAVRVGTLGSDSSQQAEQVRCTGTVVDANDQPASGVRVTLYELSQQTAFDFNVPAKQELTTAGDGKFSFSTTPWARGTRPYRMAIVVAQKEGLALGWTNWQLQEDNEFHIKMEQPKALSGKVVDENGNGVAGAEVRIIFLVAGREPELRYLSGMEPLDVLVTRTDEQGDFVFNNIPGDASGELLAKKTGRATVCTFSPEGFQGGRLQFAPGQTDIKLEMPPEAIIEGTIVEKGTANPAAGVRLMVTQGQNRPNFGQKPVTSNENGRFIINGLAGGEHVLQLVPPVEGLPDWVAEPVELTTKAGQTTSDVEVQVCKGGLLEVLLRDAETKEPLDNAYVWVREEKDEQQFGAQSDKDGIARIRLLPGEYKLSRVHKEGYVYDRQAQTVALEDGKTERIEVALGGPPKVTGVVRDPAGNPVEGASLRMCPMGHQDVTSDAEGKFTVMWNPRHWERWEEEQMVYCLVARHEEQNLAAAVEVEKGVATVDVNLVPGITVTGKVVDPNGKAIPQAKVNIMIHIRAADVGWTTSITDARRSGPTTNAEGLYEVRAIPPGREYYVNARANGYGQKNVKITVDDAENNLLKIEPAKLAPANLSVSGAVVDVNDKPVAGAMLHAYGDGQPDHIEIPTDAQGKFTIDKVCAGRIQVSASVRGEVRLRGHVETEGGAQDIKIVVSEQGSSDRFVPRQPPSLVGKALPDLNDVGVALSAADANDKMTLVCFWDMNQRPSRHCIQQLAKQAEQLKDKGVTVVTVQASKADKKALDDWTKKLNVAFPTGMIGGDEEKTRFRWGVRSLPWLILTDKEHIVRAEGFGLGELNDKIRTNGGQP